LVARSLSQRHRSTIMFAASTHRSQWIFTSAQLLQLRQKVHTDQLERIASLPSPSGQPLVALEIEEQVSLVVFYAQRLIQNVAQKLLFAPSVAVCTSHNETCIAARLVMELTTSERLVPPAWIHAADGHRVHEALLSIPAIDRSRSQGDCVRTTSPHQFDGSRVMIDDEACSAMDTAPLSFNERQNDVLVSRLQV